MSLLVSIAYMLMTILSLVGIWKTWEKAGQQGWMGIIPVLNVYTWLLIIKKPWWWILLLLIPGVNLVLLFIMGIELAKAFGKETLFGVGLILLPIIFFPILGFGEDTYKYGGGNRWDDSETLDAEIIE